MSTDLAPGLTQAQRRIPGNGHYYQLVPAPGGINFTDAALAASGMSYQGSSGHLVTVTSAAEEQFVVGTVLGAVSANEWWWLGGYQDTTAPDYREPAGGWRWVTGEPWSYTNWNQGEPNNAGVGEDVLEMSTSGGWNDLGDQILVPAYLVEFDGPFLFPDVGLSGTSLSFGSQIVGTTSAAQSVTLTNTGDGAADDQQTLVVRRECLQLQLDCGRRGRVAGCRRQPNDHGDVFSDGGGPRQRQHPDHQRCRGEPSLECRLSGSGYIPAPAVSLSPATTLDFGNLSVGTTSAPRTVTLDQQRDSCRCSGQQYQPGRREPRGSFAMDGRRRQRDAGSRVQPEHQPDIYPRDGRKLQRGPSTPLQQRSRQPAFRLS